MSWWCFCAKTQQDLDLFPSQNIRLFSYNELISATENFHPSNKLGKGGFGTVYKGILRNGTTVAAKVLSAESKKGGFGTVYKGILRNGTTVAAKVLSAESKQGVREFLTEIDVIKNVRHPNLVELVGCCVEGSHRILVYEYVENNSLDRSLLGPKSEPAKLHWAIRSQICMGTAKGLAFLHEELDPYIVHRDIKASNILLDSNFFPKIGDFGLAKLFPDNITHISTRVAGTTGYLAPEYATQGQLTKKADVYSFGVLVLEIVSGRSCSKSCWSEMETFLLEWTWVLYKEGRLTELVDPTVTDYPEEEVFRYIKVALFCTQAAATRRPSMIQVVEMLSKPLQLNEKELTPPGLIHDSTAKGGSLEASSSSSFPIKDVRSTITTVPFNSTPGTFTDMVPR